MRVAFIGDSNTLCQLLQPYKTAMDFEEASDFRGLGLAPARTSRALALPFRQCPLSMTMGNSLCCESRCGGSSAARDAQRPRKGCAWSRAGMHGSMVSWSDSMIMSNTILKDARYQRPNEKQPACHALITQEAGYFKWMRRPGCRAAIQARPELLGPRSLALFA